MTNTKQLWLCAENAEEVKLISVKALIDTQRDITIKDLKERYKEFKLKFMMV